MPKFYAQLENSIVVGVSQLKNEETDPNLIEINSLDETIMGKVWNGSTFEEV